MKSVKAKVFTGFLLFIFFIFMFPVFGAYPYYRHDDMAIYWYYSDETVTAAWDEPAGSPAYYRVRANWVRGDKILQTYDLGTTTNLDMVVPAPRAGAFIIGVQACDSSDQCSPWAKSIDIAYATVDGQPKAWILIFSLAGTGPIIISKSEEETIRWLKS